MKDPFHPFSSSFFFFYIMFGPRISIQFFFANSSPSTYTIFAIYIIHLPVDFDINHQIMEKCMHVTPINVKDKKSSISHSILLHTLILTSCLASSKSDNFLWLEKVYTRIVHKIITSDMPLL